MLMEDESLSERGCERALKTAGADLVIVQTAYQALLMTRRHRLDAGVLDLAIGADTLDRVSRWLRNDRVPFLFFASHRIGCEPYALVEGIATLLSDCSPSGPTGQFELIA